MAVLALLAGTAHAQCDLKVATSSAPQKLNVIVSDKMFSAVSRNDVIGPLKIWGEMIGCLMHVKLDVHVDTGSTPQAIRRRIAEGKVQVLSLEGEEYLALSDEGLVEGITVTGSNGVPIAPNYLLLVDSKIDSLAQLRGKRAGFYLRGGSAAPLAWASTLLAQHKMGSVESFFSWTEVLNKPTNCILPLFFGKADACIIDSLSWEMAKELNPQLGVKLKPLMHSVPVVLAVTAFTKAPIENRQKIVQAMMEMHKNPGGKQILEVFQIGMMIPYRPEYMESTRQFWDEYARSLTPTQLREWKLTLRPNLPGLFKVPGDAPGLRALER